MIFETTLVPSLLVRAWQSYSRLVSVIPCNCLPPTASIGASPSQRFLLAGFGIFNVLTMSVLAKIKEIAILRSMGYRRMDISLIFLWQGALIAAAGSLLGCLLGALMTWGVSHIPIRLRGLLYTNYFLVTWDWRHYVFATLLAILAVFIASYVPARRAARSV